MFFQKFGKKFYQGVLLREILKPRVKVLCRTGKSPSLYYHDHATNADLHDDQKVLDDVFGSCKVLPFAKKLGREARGREYIQPVDRKPFWRAKNVPKSVCDCDMSLFAVSSVFPTLNLVENVNGYLRSVWQRECGPQGKLQWYGGKQKRIDVLDKCVRIVNEDKKFFRKLYDNAHVRHEHVRDSQGEIYRFS